MNGHAFLPWETSGLQLEANAIALHLPNSPKPAYTGAGPGSLISWQLPFVLLLKPVRISYWARLTGQALLL